ncbi:MAG: hypothetical protein IKL07_06225 [Clostridium sp.]|nr:hypothetical protein [Clostridium sp.]
MPNNEERFCEHCNKKTTFFWESDLIWYCDECGKPFGSYPLIREEELEDALEEFEEHYGSAVYCGTCGNFVCVEDIIEDAICPYCADELDLELENKGYIYDEEAEVYRLDDQ